MYRITDEYIRQAVKCILGVNSDVRKNKTTNIGENENDNNADNLFRRCVNRNIFSSINDVFQRGNDV